MGRRCHFDSGRAIASTAGGGPAHAQSGRPSPCHALFTSSDIDHDTFETAKWVLAALAAR